MKLKEIAQRIQAHLKRFENDPEINKSGTGSMKLKPYWNVNAWVAGRFVGVRYVSFQGQFNITKQEAIEYLARLDEGFTGKHFHVSQPAPKL